MSFALASGVSGLQVHQKMLDVAGNNLANINTTAFKGSRITFSELLSETIKRASGPTALTGGTNPIQIGTGVGVSGITPNMTQGNIINTGNPLDLAIEGSGYFVVTDSTGQKFYTRAGAFAVDANSNLVDGATGYFVQRDNQVEGIGSVAGSDNIFVPYGAVLPAHATTEITIAGNLGEDSSLSTAQAQVATSDIAYTYDNGTAAGLTTTIGEIDQFTGGSGVDEKMGSGDAGTIALTGFNHDGSALSDTFNIDSTTTMGDILTWLNTDNGVAPISEVQTAALSAAPASGTFTLTYGGQTTAAIDWDATAGEIKTALEDLSTVEVDDITVSGAIADGVTFTFADTLGDTDPITITSSLKDAGAADITASIAETTKGVPAVGALGGDATASLVDGKIRITDNTSGYSKLDMTLAYSGDGAMTMPGYFEMTTVGGEEIKDVSITVFDSRGERHVLSGAFVRTDTANTWDMLLTSVTGNIQEITMENRRISGIAFNSNDGSYAGLGGADVPEFEITFAEDPTAPQTIAMDFGNEDELNGLTQFGGNSTAAARSQDGYGIGQLSSVTVDKAGVVIGAFSNGEKMTIAALQVALFRNASALESAGNGFFSESANSGVADTTGRTDGRIGRVYGGALEKSNADVATEFVNMIQAQNGFQANARTIKVANEILQELTRLIA
jgi:flagellar hook protein FlgE